MQFLQFLLNCLTGPIQSLSRNVHELCVCVCAIKFSFFLLKVFFRRPVSLGMLALVPSLPPPIKKIKNNTTTITIKSPLQFFFLYLCYYQHWACQECKQ